jgi:hypothetical protein
MKTLRPLISTSLLLLFGSSCVLLGIEPDEIDVADGETGTGLTGSEHGNDGEDDPAGDGDGDGDGDPTGDGDPGTGDGDGDETGDGDGDNESDTGNGDGDGDDSDSGTGDGDGDELNCFGRSPAALVEGENPVAVGDGDSQLGSTCGGDGPESVYQFTAPAEGNWQFVIESSDFTEVLVLLGSCEPLQELTCSAAPAEVQQFLSAGQTVFVIVDSELGTGAATLDISML